MRTNTPFFWIPDLQVSHIQGLGLKSSCPLCAYRNDPMHR